MFVLLHPVDDDDDDDNNRFLLFLISFDPFIKGRKGEKVKQKKMIFIGWK